MGRRRGAARYLDACSANYSAYGLAKGAAGLLPPPALSEGRHRSLARRLLAVRRRAIFVVPERKSPHPRCADRSCIGFENATDDDAVCQHVVIVVIPFAGRARGRCAFEDELGIGAS